MGWNDPLPSLCYNQGYTWISHEYIDFLSGTFVVGAIGLPGRWNSRDIWSVIAWLVLVGPQVWVYKRIAMGKNVQDKCRLTWLKKKSYFLFPCKNEEPLVPCACVWGSVGQRERLAGLFHVMGACSINLNSPIHPKHSFSLQQWIGRGAGDEKERTPPSP